MNKLLLVVICSTTVLTAKAQPMTQAHWICSSIAEDTEVSVFYCCIIIHFLLMKKMEE